MQEIKLQQPTNIFPTFLLDTSSARGAVFYELCVIMTTVHPTRTENSEQMQGNGNGNKNGERERQQQRERNVKGNGNREGTGTRTGDSPAAGWEGSE